jgi:hypothetical protein
MDRQTEMHQTLHTPLLGIGFLTTELDRVAPVLAELLRVAGWRPPPSVEHKCLLPDNPAQMPSATVWRCQEDGREYISVKRSVGRKMYGEWQPRPTGRRP